jgi:hypothetical protein
MENYENFKKRAFDKLDKEFKTLQKPKDNHLSTVVSKIEQPTLDALKSFCNQDNEFAQAVVQGGTLSECLTAIAEKFKANNYALSDFETYSEAVKFYFSTATIRFEMKIDVCGNIGGDEEPKQEKAINVNFDDLFGF